MVDVLLGFLIFNCYMIIVNVCGLFCKIIYLFKIIMKIINVGFKIDIKIIDKSDIYNFGLMYICLDCFFINFKCFVGIIL